jgi:hypothetical protein
MQMSKRFILSLVAVAVQVSAFVGPSSPITPQRRAVSSVQMMVDGSSLAEISSMAPVFTATPGLILAETEAWVQPTATLLGPFLNFLSFAMVRDV